jgi:hypothetical protein
MAASSGEEKGIRRQPQASVKVFEGGTRASET